MAKFLITVIMILSILMAVSVQARSLKYDDCFRKCSAGCYGQFRAYCVSLCSRKCKKPLGSSDSEASDSGILRCAKSTNFTSVIGKAERCLDSCFDRKSKKN